MGTEYKGYLELQDDFKRYQKQTPKGVSLQNKNNKTIVLKFKINGNHKSKGCNCSFTLDGMVSALSKAHQVAKALKTFSSESDFLEWYNREILEKGKIESDLMTFGDTIKLIEKDFWERPDRRKRKRDKNNPSNIGSWNETYYRFFKHLPAKNIVNEKDILNVLKRWNTGTKSYKSAVSVFKKLARVANKKKIIEILEKLKTTQTEFKQLQNINLKVFLDWRNETLGITKELPKNANLETRRAWLWIFSMQIVYGLRLHEVFAIQNLFTSFKTNDGVTIPALNDFLNKSFLIVVGDKTIMGTTTKTGYRIARPLAKHLIKELEINKPKSINNYPNSENPNTIRKFYTKIARDKLVEWNAPLTQTHALRHLSNLLGIRAGISQEIRAKSLGHSVEVNESIYKKRSHTQTTIDLYNKENNKTISKTEAKKKLVQLSEKYPESEPALIELFEFIFESNQET